MSEKIDEIRDFELIENAGKLESQVALSSVYSIKIGGFAEQQLKTYSSCVTIDELEQDIQFYETLSKDKSWPVSQIIQREVDKIRVSNISKDYILGQGRIVKYFPPIIVALLPKSKDERIDLKYNFKDDQNDQIKELIYEKSNYRSNPQIKNIFLKGINLSKVEGLYLLQVSKVFDFSVLCWDRTKFYAVVIDGQHRLDALIKSKTERPEIGKFIQDVVFIDFSYLANEETKKHTPIELVRRIFIDINTNAKKVGVVRQILMDDKDLASLFVQSLVNSVNKDGSEKEEGSFLKSQIVDWYGESLKHNLPHITGILSLYQILSDYLIQTNISSINDLRNPRIVSNWVKRMNEYFSVDREIETKGEYDRITKLSESLKQFNDERDFIASYADAIDDEIKESTLFQYDYSVLEIAQKSFENIYVESIVKIFEELLPYKKTITTLEENKGFETDSLLSIALLTSQKKIIASSSLKECIIGIRKELEGNLNNQYYLLFTVLSQKAFFNIFFKRVFKEYNLSFNSEKCMLIAKAFIKDINNLLNVCSFQEKKPFGKKEDFTVDLLDSEEDNSLKDLGTLITQFWEGIIYEDNKIIYNTQGILSLSSTIEFMLKYLSELENQNNSIDLEFNISFMKTRTSRILKRRFDIDENEFAEKIILKKELFIKNYLTEAFQKYQTSLISESAS